MVWFSHVGKQPLKFSFDLYICDVRGLPNEVSSIAVALDRSGKRVVSSTVPTQATGSAERYAMLDETLRTSGTLFRNTKLSRLDAKVAVIRVLDMSAGPYGSPGVLGSADFDLAAHAELNPDATAKQLQLQLPRLVGGRPHPEMSFTLQMSLTSRWLQGTAGLGADGTREWSRSEDAGVISGSSSASTALTHEALQRHMSTKQMGPGVGDSVGVFPIAGNGKAKGKAKGKDSSGRVAELSQLVAGAAADARQAESRLATLQFRLRSEVLDTTEACLERMSDVSEKKEKIKAYHAQLLLVMDLVERIAYDNGGSLGGGGGISQLESEVLTLRRDLAASKLQVALLQGENDELTHVARRLNKQLAEYASQHR